MSIYQTNEFPQSCRGFAVSPLFLAFCIQRFHPWSAFCQPACADKRICLETSIEMLRKSIRKVRRVSCWTVVQQCSKCVPGASRIPPHVITGYSEKFKLCVKPLGMFNQK